MTDVAREPDDAKVARLRELLPATSAGIYLDTATFGPLPSETAAAMREADDWELKVGRATVGRDEDLAQRIEEAQAVLAALLVGDPSEIVLAAGIEAARAIAPGGEPHDASHIVGVEPFDCRQFDAVVFACDRWLLGPEQTAALWVSPRVTRDLPPSRGLSRTAVLGLARSVGWLEMYVGLPWIYDHTAGLVNQLHAGLAAIEGVDWQASHAIVEFSVAGWPTHEVLDELRRRVFAIVGSSADDERVRASVAWFNSQEEIETFIGAVREIAGSTPDSIPRRLPLLGQQ